MRLLFLSLLMILETSVFAAPVVKWQDHNGQWHFGTPSTAPQQQPLRPVDITTPMSVIHNSNPAPALQPANRTHQPTHRAHVTTTSPTPQKLRLSQKTCDEMRDTLKLRRKHEDQRAAQLHYEQQCIMGHYYGERRD